LFDFFHFANLARKGFIRFGEGKIKVTNLRVLLFDVESLNALEKELERIFSYNGCAYILYRMTMHGGSRATKAHKDFSHYAGNELTLYMAKMATGAGWGKIMVTNLDGPINEIIVQDSPFVKRNKKYPSCHHLRGYLAGAASYIKKTRQDCIEIECKSIGSKQCKFLIARRSEFERNKNYRQYLNQISDFDFDSSSG
jgi:predicted hydrocarbon binding protein